MIRPSSDPIWTCSTLLLAATDPVLAYGKGSYLDGILSRWGVTNTTAATGWPELTLEDVQRLNPGAIVVVGDAADADANPMDLLGPIASLNIDAISNGRVGVLASDDAELPSSAVRFVAAELHRILARFAESSEQSD